MVGTVIVNQGKVVRPSQLIRGVGRTQGGARSSFNTTICALEALLEHELRVGPCESWTGIQHETPVAQILLRGGRDADRKAVCRAPVE